MSLRKIYITGDITHEAYALFADEMSLLEEKSRTEDIFIEICSGGGIANVAYAYAARIRKSPCVAHTIGMGEIASAATLILVSGDLRAMTKEALIMVHEDSGKFSGSISEIEKQAEDARFMEDHWNKWFARHTSKTKRFWAMYNKETVWFNARAALECGIVDRII